MFGILSGADLPARTSANAVGSKPDRARDTWSARYTGRSFRRKYSLQPMRPSGVVSHVLLERQQPCTMTTGTCCSPFIGIWYCTYIWLTVISPLVAGAFGPKPGCVIVLFSPPTKKLPCSLIVSGPGAFFVWADTAAAATAATATIDAIRSFMGGNGISFAGDADASIADTVRGPTPDVDSARSLGAELVCHRVPAHARDVRPCDRRRRQESCRGRDLLDEGLLGAPRAHHAARADRTDRLHRCRVAGHVAAARVHCGSGAGRSRGRRDDGPRLDGRRVAALGPWLDRRPDLSAVPDSQASTARLPACGGRRVSRVDVHVACGTIGI